MHSTNPVISPALLAVVALGFAAATGGCGDSNSPALFSEDAGDENADQGKGGSGNGGSPQGGDGGSGNGDAGNGGSGNGGTGGGGGDASTASCEPDEIACGDKCCDGDSQQCVANACVCRTNTVCGEGKVCDHTNSCVAGCLINGSAFAEGTQNPNNDCQICASSNTTAWVSASPGSSCAKNGGDTCNTNGVCLKRRKLSAGEPRSCAVTPTGSAVCWGGNGTGTVGDGKTAAQVVDQSPNVMSISSGGSHTCSLSMDGTVMCWGTNTYGQVGNGTILFQHVPVAITELGTGARYVSAGVINTCAITADGGAMCWGNNSSGQLGNGTTISSLTPTKVSGFDSEVVDISIGSVHTCALNIEGGIKCWGSGVHGQLGTGFHDNLVPVPTQVQGLETGVTAIAAGADHTCALTVSGGVLCWGRNAECQLGDSTTASKHVPTPVVGLSSGIVAIAAGYDHSCAVNAAGGVRCWGFNDYQQLGDGSEFKRCETVQVANLYSGVTAVSAARYHTCAYTSPNKIMCWGRNGNYQLGIGVSTAYNSSPIEVIGFP
ncbi:MAG: hypothetical protein FWD57_16935 [Polyangiaceae bacterium]|nr:hypothetical protein [Polyangiaceae bacterium]